MHTRNPASNARSGSVSTRISTPEPAPGATGPVEVTRVLSPEDRFGARPVSATAGALAPPVGSGGRTHPQLIVAGGPPTSKLQVLLAEHPELKTHQDLINYFYRTGRTALGAQSLAQAFDVSIAELAMNRGAKLSRDANPVLVPLELGDTGEAVATLQRDLRQLGYLKGNADGIYGPVTTAALKRLAADHGIDVAGDVLTPELAELIRAQKGDVALEVLRRAVTTLSAELFDKAPDVLARINTALKDAHSATSDADKELVLRQAFEELQHDMEDAGDTLSEEARAAWSLLQKDASAALESGSLLGQSRLLEPTYQQQLGRQLDKLAKQLGEDLAEHNSIKLAKIVARIREIKKMPEGPEKVAALQDAAFSLDQGLKGLGNQLSPLALVRWQTVMSLLHAGFGELTVLPLLTRAAPDPQFLKILEAAIAPLEAAADEAPSKVLTPEMLRAIVPSLSATRAAELTPFIEAAFKSAKMTTPRQKAAFIAQCAHETGGFATFREYGSDAYFRRYDGRKDLGNTQPGDGARFRGRGALQLTGRTNYKKASLFLFGDTRLLSNPKSVEEPALAFAVSAWFWDSRKLNGPAEAGDFKLVTRRVNGGYNGYEDRLKYYARALKAYGAPAQA